MTRIVLRCILLCLSATNIVQAAAPVPVTPWVPPISVLSQAELVPLLEAWDRAMTSSKFDDKNRVLAEVIGIVSEEKLFAGLEFLYFRLLSVEKPRPKSGQPTREHLAIAELARTIGKNKDISPQIRVNVLTTVLSKEIEDPCSLNLIPNGYLTLSGYLQRQYIFALVDIGPEAIPNLRRHLKHLELRMEPGSGSLGKPQSVKHRSNVVVEKQLTLCTLGFHRDKTVFPEVMDIFLETEDGYVRSLAALALEKLKNRAAIPALKRALKDDFHVTFTTCVVRRNSGNRRIIYPVREAASSALRAMGVKVVRKGNNFRVVQ